MTKDNFSENVLYGDQFTIEEIEDWYNQEKEAYAELGSKDKNNYDYLYHEGNIDRGFRHLKDDALEQVLGFGSAYGEEFIPIISKIKNLTIIEPSDQLKSTKIGDIYPNYIKPSMDGKMNFSDNTFDLITSFGVLHHVPNVSFVLSELIRVLKPGGYIMIKEPISTMGDWSQPREGLTKNERGISLFYFEKIFKDNNVRIVRKTLIDNLAVYKIVNKIFPIPRKSKLFIKFDNFFSKLFSWNYSYHRTSMIKKVAPSGVFYIISK
jgi:SAM-dependent methyltransferase